MCAPATRRSTRRCCSRRSRSSTSRARTSAGACSSPPIRTAANCACGPISPFRCRATICNRRGRQGRGLLLSRLGVSPSRGRGRPKFLQAGIESFGRQDKAAADAEMLSLGLEATALYGLPTPEIRMGDVGLFAALVAALDLAPAWKRRLVKDFNRKCVAGARSRPARARTPTSGRRNTRACSPRSPAPIPRPRIALVTDLLSIAGINAVGGRSVGEIAERFLEQAALGAATAAAARDPRADRALPRRSRGDPDEAAGRTARARRRRRACARRRRSICSKAAPAFSPRAASMSARIRFSTALRPRPRLLHRLRVRAARSGARRAARWSPAAATTAC